MLHLLRTVTIFVWLAHRVLGHLGDEAGEAQGSDVVKSKERMDSRDA